MSRTFGAMFRIEHVLFDISKFHYFAWRRLAEELGLSFTEEDNDRCQGLSSLRCLEILLEKGGLDLSEKDKAELCERKLGWLIELLGRVGPLDVATGARETLRAFHSLGHPTAVIADKPELQLLLKRLELETFFDLVIGPSTPYAIVPVAQDYLVVAEALDLQMDDLLCFECTPAGIEAARTSRCTVVGVGPPRLTQGAHLRIPGLWAFRPERLAPFAPGVVR